MSTQDQCNHNRYTSLLLRVNILLFIGYIAVASVFVTNSAYAACIAGLPCVTPFTVDINPYDGNIKSNTSGNNKSKSTSGACDADFMNQIYAKAFMEAEREKTLLQTTISKPDSVLEFSCFDPMVGLVSRWSPETFSESKRWSKTECENDPTKIPYNPVKCSTELPKKLWEVNYDYKAQGTDYQGSIDKQAVNPTELGVYMANGIDYEKETRMGRNLQELVTKSLDSYLNSNFYHSYLGGQFDPSGKLPKGANNEVNSTNTYYGELISVYGTLVCPSMQMIWALDTPGLNVPAATRCLNFDHLLFDKQLSLEESLLAVTSLDPRLLPQQCSTKTTSYAADRAKYLAVARNKVDPTELTSITRVPIWSWFDPDAYLTGVTSTKTYKDFTTSSSCFDPIPTGLEVSVKETTVSATGQVNVKEKIVKSHICVNPNCYYNANSNKCVK